MSKKENLMNMKANFLKYFALPFLVLGFFFTASAEDEEKSTVSISLEYLCYDNKLPFVNITTRTRVERRWQPAGGVEIKLYLNEIEEEYLAGIVVTNDNGQASIVLPPSLKDVWNADVRHIFYAISSESERYEEGDADMEIVRARLTMDTISDGEYKSIVIRLEELTEDGWVIPLDEAEVQLGVKRMGGMLNIGSVSGIHYIEEGEVIVDYDIENLPGDENGKITLIAKLNFNDTYGTLIAEIHAPWGVPLVIDNSNFHKRSLWGKRSQVPIWLLVSANGILILVWGTLAYLLILLIRIIRLGREEY